jgi:cyclopropane fatty-acyl-phospholipid synthase-like methyltransferase
MKTPFNEDYYMRGPDTGLSNYRDYRWMPDATISMATHLKRFLGISQGETLLDVGCARGFYVKALRMIGVNAFGYDVSEWAIANCDPDVAPFVRNHFNGEPYDYVFSKDCFEHVPHAELETLVKRLLLSTGKTFFAIVPLAFSWGGRYVHPKEEQDSTHVIRWAFTDWLQFFDHASPDFVALGSLRYPGLKPGCFECEGGYGFFKLERI